MTNHNALANSELHEPKDVSTANNNRLYWADGQGSGDWKPIIQTAGSWTHSTNVSEVEFTELDEYAFLQIDLVGIELDSSTDQHILCQVGNDSGFVTSSIYYSTYWSSGGDASEVLAGVPLGFFRDNTPANSLVNFSTCFLSNFNQTNTTIGYSQDAYDASTTAANSFFNRVHWIREQQAYNKIKIKATNDLSGGTIVVSGYRWFNG